MWSRLALTLGPDGVLTALAVLVFSAVAVHLGGALAVPTDTVAPYLLVGGALLGATALVKSPLLLGRRDGDRRRFVATQVRAVRVWAPFVILYLCYRALRGVLLLIPPSRDQAALLKRCDEAIFGVSPAWWMEQFATPWLTELLSLAYATMFILPMIVLVVLYARGHDRVLRRAALALLVAFHLGFVIFLLVPARSPDVVYDFATPLHGHGFYEWSTAAWARLQQITFDAFPSMHTCISTLALVLAHRHGALLWPRRPRLVFGLFLPAVVLLQIATLYLRQHYFVDLVAGWLLAAVSLFFAGRAMDAWDRLEAR
jgi:membrane-associated phospholipid phosphatase